MSKEYGIRVRCDGCGEESEWATPDPFGGTLGQGLDDLRATLARRKWGRDDDEGDLCPLCVRADLQRGRLVPDEKGARS